MVDENGFPALRKAPEPLHALLGDERRGHPHIRAAVAAYEAPALAHEFESLVSEYFLECIATALGPLRIVVAGHCIVLCAKGIEHPFHIPYLLICSEIREVPSYEDEIQAFLAVHVADASPDVLHGLSTL